MISTCSRPLLRLAGHGRGDEADPTHAAVDVVIDVNSIDTREAQRDAHLKSEDFFDAGVRRPHVHEHARHGCARERFKLAGI